MKNKTQIKNLKLEKELKIAKLCITILFVIVIIFLVTLVAYSDKLNKTPADKICVPKYQAHYTSLLDSYSVTVLDLDNQMSLQLDQELGKVVGEINNLILKGGAN